MKKEYDIINLHCGGCAAKIQYELDRLEYLKDVNVNFYTKKLSLVLKRDIKELELLKELNRITDKIESGTRVKQILENEKIEKNIIEFNIGLKIDMVLLIIGITLFTVGTTLPIGRQKNIILFISYVVTGYDILFRTIKNILKGKILDENFLMSMASVGALILGEYSEATMVMIFYKVGEFFQEIAVNNSKKSIEKLMSIKPDYANLKGKNGEIKIIDPSDVIIGSIIIVKPGERVPLDGEIILGTTMLDRSPLTGESIPVIGEVGDKILSGSININGTIEIKVTKQYSESTVNRIIEMVQNAGNKKAKAEKFITKFARYYTPIVVSLAVIIATIIPIIYKVSFKNGVQLGLIFLVISCPCSLVLSVPLTFFSSIGRASKDGILIKGGNYLERLKKIDTVIFDKTGTLTNGKFKVTKINVVKGTEEELISYAKAGEYYSNHPIGRAIVEYKNIDIDENDIDGHNEKAGYGVRALYKNKMILVGNSKFLKENTIKFEENDESNTVVYVAVDEEFLGTIYVEDEIKENATKTINTLKTMGINVYMLTGDNEVVGKHKGKILGFDQNKVFTNLLPENKVKKLEEIKSKSKKGTIYVGDGINDAPALSIADIGISMGRDGSDIAVESSDIVLINDDPYKIIDVLKIAKLNKRVVAENIIISLGIKIGVIVLAFTGIMHLWLAIFSDVGAAVLSVLNASKILKKSHRQIKRNSVK